MINMFKKAKEAFTAPVVSAEEKKWSMNFDNEEEVKLKQEKLLRNKLVSTAELIKLQDRISEVRDKNRLDEISDDKNRLDLKLGNIKEIKSEIVIRETRIVTANEELNLFKETLEKKGILIPESELITKFISALETGTNRIKEREKSLDLKIKNNLFFEFLRALSENNAVKIKNLVSYGINLDLLDSSKWRHLLNVKNKEMLTLLVKLGTDLNLANFEEMTLLNYTIAEDKPEMVKLLIANGANPDSQIKDGFTPLRYAIIRDKPEMVKFLIDNGANPNLFDASKLTPLRHAIRWNRLEIVKLLIANGANINLRDKDDEIPLANAMTKGKLEMIKLLLANGANPDYLDKDKCTPLKDAILLDKQELVELLLTNGANPDFRTKDNDTPLKSAICDNKLELVKLLLANGANPDFCDASEWTPLKDAILRDKLEMVKLLIENGANINLRDKNDETPIVFAIRTHKEEIVKILLSLGADINLKDSKSKIIFEIDTTEDIKEILYQQKIKRDPQKKIGEAQSYSAMAMFDDIIGLNSVKDNIKGIINNIKIQKLRNSNDVISAGHYIFQGNPGTGKTTIARIMDDIMKELGVLANGHLVEVTREDLVGSHIGETAKLTKAKLEEALGGILFIDEAYSLVGTGNDFGQEAINTIVPFMENHKDDFILIVAGYTDDMRNFLNENTGLKSRFTYTLDFEDYSNAEMLEIFKINMKKEDFILQEGVEKVISLIFNKIRSKSKHFGNAREARKLFELMQTELNTRLAYINDLTPGDPRLYALTFDDIPKQYQSLCASHTDKKSDRVDIQTVLRKFEDIVGLNSVKNNIEGIINKINLAKRRKNDEDISAGHYIFSGNPGTGKTTVARLLLEVFESLDILDSQQIVEVKREDLVGRYVGETAQKTKAVLESALGGILFIDEAYTLVRGGENDFGKEAIDTIVPFMEDHRNDFILIVAGYPNDMKNFLDANSGLKSRFNHNIEFEDYSNEEMLEIFYIYLKDKKYKVEDGIDDQLREFFETIRSKSEHFGNARDVRKLFDEICQNMDDRLGLDDSIEDEDELNLILNIDLVELDSITSLD